MVNIIYVNQKYHLLVVETIFDALFATTICVIYRPSCWLKDYSVNTFQICHDHIDSTMQ